MLVKQFNGHEQPTLPGILLFIAILMALSIGGCAPMQQNKPYSHERCMDTVPKKVKGLQILSGSRTAPSIVRDMVPAVCYGKVLYHHLQEEGGNIGAGRVIFRITVEYTGEVYRAKVEESSIRSEHFLRKLSDIIMDTDFVGWAPGQSETEFLYPMAFGD